MDPKDDMSRAAHAAARARANWSQKQYSTHSRAKKGGELGANGEWYEGGKFIATTQRPKGTPEKRKKPSGKQEIEPYRWEVAPTEGLRSIYRQLAGIEIFDRTSRTFRFNPDLRLDFATTEAIARRKELIAKWNAGERWI